MSGIIGWSTRLEFTTHPTVGSYTQVAETVMIAVPGTEVTKVEDTHLGVTNMTRTYVPGLRDKGTISCEVNYGKDTMVQLDGLVGSMRNWRITAPDEDGAGAGTAQIFTFAGFVSKIDPTEFKPDEIVKTKFEITVAGAVTLA